MYESRKDKGKRLFETGRVKLIKEDDYEMLFLVDGNNGKETEVSFCKPTKEIKCFNAQCSLWRSKKEHSEICYHIWAVRSFITDMFKNK